MQACEGPASQGSVINYVWLFADCACPERNRSFRRKLTGRIQKSGRPPSQMEFAMKASSTAGRLTLGFLACFALTAAPASGQVRAGPPAASFAPRAVAQAPATSRGSMPGLVAARHGRGAVVAGRVASRPLPARGDQARPHRPSYGAHHPHHGGRPGRPFRGVFPGAAFAPGYLPYGDDVYARPRETLQQVVVQPVVTQTQIVTQAPAYDPVMFRCSGPRIIEVAPTRGRMKTPRVIYGTPDPCQVRASAAAGIRAAY